MQKNNMPIRDRIFLKLVNIIFYIIYGYFDPQGTITSFSIAVNHYKQSNIKEDGNA